MQTLNKILRLVLIILMIFLTLTTFAGGIALTTGIVAPPLEQLQGSIFNNYTIPGLSLFAIVGGSALIATILLIRRSKYALLASLAAAIIIMFFEFVEVLAIGSPLGIARNLQVLYYGLGTVIAIVACVVWFFEIHRAP
jgi:hypothetical protein